ncbi:MAG TPA: hypothetical protein EYQ83_05630 [Acidobacteria bacterium]|nr:hypothetical protein [Acidobacteriota bacterium]
MTCSRRFVVTAATGLATLFTLASPAAAQLFAPPSDYPVGEIYHVELFGGLWTASPDMTVSSDAFGIAGTEIDFMNDLGIGTEKFGELRIRLRPARKHRFRIDYIPAKFSAQNTVERRIVFRGIAYDIGLPVTSALTWRTWRLGYEYDIIHRSGGYFGLILEAKYTDIEASLDAPPLAREFTRARGPIPAIGAIVKVYPLSVLAVTAEVSGLKVPNNALESFKGEYIDFDISATLNFIENLGVQAGYRSLDLNVSSNEEAVALKLTGAYVGALIRFLECRHHPKGIP